MLCDGAVSLLPGSFKRVVTAHPGGGVAGPTKPPAQARPAFPVRVKACACVRAEVGGRGELGATH